MNVDTPNGACYPNRRSNGKQDASHLGAWASCAFRGCYTAIIFIVPRKRPRLSYFVLYRKGYNTRKWIASQELKIAKVALFHPLEDLVNLHEMRVSITRR